MRLPWEVTVPRSVSSSRGVTLIEIMTVVGIIAILTAVTASSLTRSRPRANLTSITVTLQAALHAARQQALASGEEVAVMVFPGYSPATGVTGRVVIYQDGDASLFSASADVNFDDYDPAVEAHGPRSEIIGVIDLPDGIQVGPQTGLGTSAALPAPWGGIPVTADCTFCEGAGTDRRGAIVFDPRGRARFFSKTGPALSVDGGSLSLVIPALAGASGQNQIRTVAVGSSTGAIRAFNNG